jgi:putative transposase
MPRRARIALPNVPLHLIQRGNNRQSCFFADEDYRNYLDWLAEYAGKTGCRLHAYVLMTNHVHLLVSAERGGSSGEMMKALGQRYVQYVVELNPVRAAMVEHPADYRWSSYRANAQGEENALVQPHERYLALGPTPAVRQANYRELFRHELDPGMIDAIRNATNGNFALGDNRFAEQVAATLGRRVVPGKPGRPMKVPEPESGSLFQEKSVVAIRHLKGEVMRFWMMGMVTILTAATAGMAHGERESGKSENRGLSPIIMDKRPPCLNS